MGDRTHETQNTIWAKSEENSWLYQSPGPSGGSFYSSVPTRTMSPALGNDLLQIWYSSSTKLWSQGGNGFLEMTTVGNTSEIHAVVPVVKARRSQRQTVIFRSDQVDSDHRLVIKWVSSVCNQWFTHRLCKQSSWSPFRSAFQGRRRAFQDRPFHAKARHSESQARLEEITLLALSMGSSSCNTGTYIEKYFSVS